MNKIEEFNKKQIQTLPVNELKFKTGYTVRVYQKVKEGDKHRLQAFEGLIIAIKHGQGINGTITVRKVSNGVGVERIFPIHAPFVEKIEIVRKSKVRRAKLYYIRQKSAKGARLKEIKEVKTTKTKVAPEKPKKEIKETKAEPTESKEPAAN